MISGMHVIFYSRHAERVREFPDDALGWRSVDAGGGWPIFAVPRTVPGGERIGLHEPRHPSP